MAFHRRQRRPRPRIPFRDERPEAERERLVRMTRDLNDLIELLWFEVEGLRRELTVTSGREEVMATYPAPPTEPMADEASGELPLPALRRVVDRAQAAADELWYESQWLRSQIDAVRERKP